LNEDLLNHIIEVAVEKECEKGQHLYVSALQSFWAAVKEIPGAEEYREALTSDEVMIIVREIHDQAMPFAQPHPVGLDD
jgi:hypothetical protein